MCRCFAADLDWNALAAQFGVAEEGDESDVAPLPRPSYNITPGRSIAIVAEGKDGHRHLAGARWSLVPAWSHDPSLPYPTYNARIESASRKPTYAASTASMRAIIPASGYYEFHGRRPFYFHAPDDGPLAMAGLFSWWRTGPTSGSPQGSPRVSPSAPSPWLLTATILTCPAVDGPATVHDRMPALVPPDMTAAWLDRRVDGSTLLPGLVASGTEISRRLAFHEVAPFTPSQDGRRLIRPLARRQTATLF